MVKDYKTMKWVETLSEDDDDADRLQVSECEVCHGFSLDWCEDPGELTCVLCDEGASLEEKYRMALNTLGCSVWPPRYWNQEADASIFGFPSFRRIYRRDGDMDGMTASFDDDDLLVTAGADGISIKAPGKHSIRYEFSDRLDVAYPHLFSRRLAQEVVNRVRHDLELKYAKEA